MYYCNRGYFSRLEELIKKEKPFERVNSSAKSFATTAEKYMQRGLTSSESQKISDFFEGIYQIALAKASTNTNNQIIRPEINKALEELKTRVDRHLQRSLKDEFNPNRQADYLIGHTGLMGEIHAGLTAAAPANLHAPLYVIPEMLNTPYEGLHNIDSHKLKEALCALVTSYEEGKSQIAESAPWMILVDEGILDEKDIRPPYVPELRHETVQQALTRIPRELREWIAENTTKMNEDDISLLERELDFIEESIAEYDNFISQTKVFIEADCTIKLPNIPSKKLLKTLKVVS